MGFLIHIHRAKDGIIQVPFSAPGIYQLISISSECPYLQPESGQLCASSYGDNSCLYSGDLCCCDRCSDYFTFSCVLNSTTGDHHWQSSLCPAEGCGSGGECCRNHIYRLSLLLSTHNLPVLLLLLRLGRVALPNQMNFRKSSKGGGGGVNFQ